MDGYTFRGSNPFRGSYLIRGQVQLLKGIICCPRSKFFPLRVDYFERAALSGKADRKSQKLFPFVKMIETHGRVILEVYLDMLINMFVCLQVVPAEQQRWTS